MGIISEIKIWLALRKPLAKINSASKQCNASFRQIKGTPMEGEMLAKGFTPQFLNDFDELGIACLDKYYTAVLCNERLNGAMALPDSDDFLADYPDLKSLNLSEEMPMLALYRNFAGLIDKSPVGKALNEYKSRKPMKSISAFGIYNEIPTKSMYSDFCKQENPEYRALLLLAENLLDEELYLMGALRNIVHLARLRREFDSLKTEAEKSPFYLLLSDTGIRRFIDGDIFEKERKIRSTKIARQTAGYISVHSYGLKEILEDYSKGIYCDRWFDIGCADDLRNLAYLLDSNAEILANAADAPERYARKFLMAKEKLDRYGLDCFDSHFYNKNLGDRVVRLFSDDLVKGTEAYKWHRYC